MYHLLELNIISDLQLWRAIFHIMRLRCPKNHLCSSSSDPGCSFFTLWTEKQKFSFISSFLPYFGGFSWFKSFSFESEQPVPCLMLKFHVPWWISYTWSLWLLSGISVWAPTLFILLHGPCKIVSPLVSELPIPSLSLFFEFSKQVKVFFSWYWTKSNMSNR